MAPDALETELIAARALRDMARGIVRTDWTTLRQSLSERPIARRVRDKAFAGARDAAKGGADLARHNLPLLGLAGAAAIGWLFRKRLGALCQTGWSRIAQRIAALRKTREPTA